MNISYLLIGGNEGDRTANLQQARLSIRDAGILLLQASSIYETAAWGKTNQPSFLNQALCISTPLDAPNLLRTLLAIESKMGRTRSEKYGARIIDIDILFFNDAIIDLPELSIPHPHIPERRFALTPMAEISPDWIHPSLHKTISTLLDECPDTLGVQLYPG